MPKDPTYGDLIAKLPDEVQQRIRASVDGFSVERRCLTCNSVFKSPNSRRKFCSDQCRMKYHRVKRLVEEYQREQQSEQGSGPGRVPDEGYSADDPAKGKAVRGEGG